MMRQRFMAFAVAGSVLSATGRAQTHPVKKPETVVRAVGVYEWTGEEGKPKASRLVPVSLYINGQLEDAGLYLARPVPFALQTGNIFELEKAGVAAGTLELAYERHLQTAGTTEVDDGWLGYGAFKPRPAEKVAIAKKNSGPLPKVEVSGGNRPHFSNKTDDARDSSADKKDVDRSSAAGGGTTVSAPPADDPDRPTMKRKTDADADPKSATTADSDSAADDPERPTLRRRTPEQRKAATKSRDQASVSGIGSLNDDPDRPNLHRGKPASRMDEDDLPPLEGLPADMRQMVAISDARDRPEHDFRRPWESDAERGEVLRKLQEIAHIRLEQYDAKAGDKTSMPTPAPVNRTAGSRAGSAAGSAGGSRTRKRGAAATPAPSTLTLTGETLSGYTLSYGGAATYVYTASSPIGAPPEVAAQPAAKPKVQKAATTPKATSGGTTGTPAGTAAAPPAPQAAAVRSTLPTELRSTAPSPPESSPASAPPATSPPVAVKPAGPARYVTVVAQREPQGELKVALVSVTDSAHLDRTPWMRLVDVVDAEASNRASLLFELRAQSTRQFALYRVIGATADQAFVTGTAP